MDYAYSFSMTLTIDLEGHDLICPQTSIMFICVHYENLKNKSTKNVCENYDISAFAHSNFDFEV